MNTSTPDKRASRRTRNLMISAVIVAVFVAVAAVIVAINSGSEKDQPDAGADIQSVLVRDNSHRVGPVGDGKVTLVEFLDFECEACGAAFPFVEQLRETYSGRVTFVVRYFPIPSHFNAERAARAVEAAAGQGAFEAMYKKMYETQSEWAEQRVPKDDVFRGFASELGLNMTQWDSAYSDPATLQRIKDDVADGRTLGVQGTPTFFLDGVKLQPRSAEDFIEAIDAALAK
ncbi:thioredoxin domain-containing protein [Nocardia farcinica]|nr:thioredoxin domain-containing protein [Nocardia farcinica]MBF6461768.1 thioredoxin domain-containing protein [Nocardia puris]MBF6235123.1 thioredoxin domain-containing protein [Nocardia farcinica]MBF6253880.1 thioredoxin domain-containing protein [Nocardia farcinica]MBF6257754.1 thioredoxin domain-containing protein [Nocardia farcinica]